MAEEEKTAGLTAEEEEAAVGEAILTAERGGAPKQETEEKAEAEPKKEEAEEKGEQKPETKAEEQKPEKADTSEADKKLEGDIAKYLKQFKGDAKEAVKAYVNLKGLGDKQAEELGATRKEAAEYAQFKKAWQENPVAVIEHLQKQADKAAGKKVDLAALAMDDAEKFNQTIREMVADQITQQQEYDRQQAELAGKFPGWKDRETNRMHVKTLIDTGAILPDEIIDGYVRSLQTPDQKALLEQAKEKLIDEQERALAAKNEAAVGHQGGGEVETGKEKSLDEEYGDILLNQTR